MPLWGEPGLNHHFMSGVLWIAMQPRNRTMELPSGCKGIQVHSDKKCIYCIFATMRIKQH